jgi:hypothetical protein
MLESERGTDRSLQERLELDRYQQAAARARREALERYLRARAARTQRLRPRKPASMPRATVRLERRQRPGWI